MYNEREDRSMEAANGHATKESLDGLGDDRGVMAVRKAVK